MENASKALIIAGAILLAILLITLGIIVYRQASGVIDKNSMDETAVATFNEKFLQYAGDNVRGTQVNALLDTVIQNNLSNEGDISKQVGVNAWFSVDNMWNGNKASNSGDAGYETIKSREQSGRALTGKSYKIQYDTDPKSGYIYRIRIRSIR